MSAKPWFVYLVRCRNGTLYTGISTDVQRRFEEHQQGAPKGARYLRGKGPLALVFQEQVRDRSQASRIELWLKKQPRKAKEALVMNQTTLLNVFMDKEKQ